MYKAERGVEKTADTQYIQERWNIEEWDHILSK